MPHGTHGEGYANRHTHVDVGHGGASIIERGDGVMATDAPTSRSRHRATPQVLAVRVSDGVSAVVFKQVTPKGALIATTGSFKEEETITKASARRRERVERAIAEPVVLVIAQLHVLSNAVLCIADTDPFDWVLPHAEENSGY